MLRGRSTDEVQRATTRPRHERTFVMLMVRTQRRLCGYMAKRALRGEALGSAGRH